MWIAARTLSLLDNKNSFTNGKTDHSQMINQANCVIKFCKIYYFYINSHSIRNIREVSTNLSKVNEKKTAFSTSLSGATVKFHPDVGFWPSIYEERRVLLNMALRDCFLREHSITRLVEGAFMHLPGSFGIV